MRVFLTDEIEGDSKVVQDALAALYAYGSERFVTKEEITPVQLVITSPGGDLWLSQALADAVEYVQLTRPVHALVTGCAMSGAMWPLIVCQRRSMTRDAVLMVHGLSEGGHWDVKGQKNEARLNTELVKRQADFFAKYTRRDADYWLPILEDNSPNYYFGPEALEIGLVDELCL